MSRSGTESQLVNLEGVPLTRVRELDGDVLKRSIRHVVDRANLVHAGYRSSNASGGERID